MTGDRPVVLVLRALHLGDTLTGLPALAMLRSALPGHRIVLAIPDRYAGIALAAGSVDATTPGWELEPLSKAPRDADLGVDLHGNGPASRALLAATGVRRLISYHGGPVRWDAGEHEVSRWCRLVGESLEVPRPWPRLAGSLPRPLPPPGLAGAVVLHPGASAPSRRWPEQRFRHVRRNLEADGHRVLVTAGPGEEALAGRIASSAGHVLAGVDLAHLLAVVAHARLLVSGETGVAHAAAVFAVPSVTLFGPVSPTQWGPPSDGPHVAIWHDLGGGDPHGLRPDPALLAISAEQAIQAARTVLA